MKPPKPARRPQPQARAHTPDPPMRRSALASPGSRTAIGADPLGVVVVDLHALKAAIREVFAEMMTVPAAPEFYSQACLPPGMTRRAFLDAIRRGDLPARASGKARFVARADYHAFIAKASPVRVCVDKQPTPANDVRTLVRAAQGK
jgi:hypothetical protein